MKDLKVQINSLEALERLIGGESKLEFDIRQNIVEAFAKKHLKTIANSDLIKKVEIGLKKELEDEFVRKSSSWSGSYSLTTKAIELLKKQIEYLKSTLVNKLVEEHFEKSGLDELIKEKAEFVAGRLTESVLSAKFNKAVEAEIKKRLGIK